MIDSYKDIVDASTCKPTTRKPATSSQPAFALLLLAVAATLLLALLPPAALAATPITNCTELQNIRNNLGGNYYLGNDIDCSCTSGWNGGAGFEPIGIFTGTFDGKGYKITNLYINLPSTICVGLFGDTGSGSEIKDVGLEEVNVRGNEFVGGLVGSNKGIITNSYSSCSVNGSGDCVGGLVGWSGGTITNSYSSGSVTGSDDYVGGLVGKNGGTITSSYSSGSVTGSGNYVGGLAGYNYVRTITSSYSSCSVNGSGNCVGGLVGYNFDGPITSSYSSGSVTGSGDTYVGGLVGYNYAGTITNSYSSGSVTGSSEVGGLAGSNEGTITSSYSSGSVTGSSEVGGLVGNNSNEITSSYSSGSVSGDGSVGGLVGDNWEGPITSSYSSGSVTGSMRVGGLVGYVESGGIINSYSSSSVSGVAAVGGLVGLNFGTITNSYSSGSVSGSSEVGGLVGFNFEGPITNSYWDTETSGQSSSDGGTGKTTAQMKQQATFSGWDFDTIWAIVEGVTYPYLQWQHAPKITSFAPPSPVYDTVCTWRTFNVTVNQEVNVSWYLNNTLQHTNESTKEASYTLHAEVVGEHNVSAIASNENGMDMHTWVWNMATPITTCTELQNMKNYLAGHYCLGNDIDCSCTSGWNDGAGFEPIGTMSTKFTGTFDGKGYKITHLYINRPSTDYVVGLFGYTGSGSEINDVGLEEVDVRGGTSVGGLVGTSDGTITNSYSSGSVSGHYNVGGLVGFNWNEITNSYSSGSVSGMDCVGGLVGFNGGMEAITNSYYPGDDITCTGCDNTIGNTTKANLQHKIWLTTPPNNWDFVTIWGIEEGVTYPYLQWQHAPKITSFAPTSPVYDTVCTWRTFSVTVNQEVNVNWYLNNTLQHTNESTKEASYTLHAEVVGEHNVSAIATNENGTDMQNWVWNVAPVPALEINKTSNPDPVPAGGTLNYSIHVNNTGNATATNVTVTETYDGNVTFGAAVPAPSQGNDTWIFSTLNVSETKWINVSVTVNASVFNGTVLHNIVNVTCEEGVADYYIENTTVFSDVVHITSFAPPSPVNDTVCNWRTFNVSVDQTVNVSWYLNGSLLFTNGSVRAASCRLHADAAGVHNVSANASNANSSDIQTWIWNVTVGLNCTCGDICVNETGWWRDGEAFFASGTPIQHAIENATAGDTICVKDGTYNENVDVTKSDLTIRSENGPSVTTVSASLNPNKHVFNIADQTNVTLEGFEIRDAHGTSQHVAGIYMYNASECNISDNVVTDISTTGTYYAYGIWLYSSSDNNSFDTTTIYNLSADYYAYGIYLDSSSGNSFDTSTVYNLDAGAAYGIWLISSSDNSFDTSTVYNLSANYAYGIYLYSSSDNNSFHTSTVYNLSSAEYEAYGILLYSSSDNSFDTSTVYNLSAHGSAYGISLYFSSDNLFDTSTVYNLSANSNAYGIYLDYSNANNSFSSGSISDINAPTWWDFYSKEDAHGNSAGNIRISSIATTISFTYDNGIKLKSVVTPPADPAGKRNISKYVHVTEVTAESWIFMNVSYEEGDLGGVVEDSLRLWQHNGIDWTEVPGTNGVNTAENYVYANITEFSVFAPLGNVTGVNLEINKTGVPDPVSPGGTLNYTISVNNTGNATATNVTVTETYDVNVTFVSAVPAPSLGNDTWIFATLNVNETRWINISVTVNASTANGTVLHNIVNVSCEEGVADYDVENTTVFPDVVLITSFAPPSPVNDTVCNWRTFNVSVDRTVNVSWYLNGSLLFTNKSVRDASCRLHADAAGVHNVSANASNANSSDMQTWIWNVTVLNCTCGDICVNTTGWWRDGGAFVASNTPIQHAIDNATAGDTICVKDGTYTENVDVTKSNLTIRSANGPSVTTVSASLYPNKDVFKISDQTNVTLEGFEIRDARGTSQSVAGIYMYNACECNISDNIVTNISATGTYNDAYGIYLYSSSDNSFDTSTVYNLSSADGDAYGIYLYYYSSNNTFSSSTSVYNLSSNDGNAHGIYLYYYSSNNTFSSSTSVYNLDAGAAFGIWLVGSSNNMFSSSTSVYNLDAGNAFGIRLDSSSDNTFSSSTSVYNLDAGAAYGIWLSSSSDNTFGSSTSVYNLSSADDSAYGIWLSSSSDNTFGSSTSVYNLSANLDAYGIRVYASSNNNSFSSSTTVYNLDAGAAYGIWLDSSSNNNSFHTSTVYNISSANAAAYGITLSSSSGNSFDTSTTVYNLSANYDAYGISLYSSSDNSFVTTTVYNLSANTEAYGIYLWSSSDNSFSSGSISDIKAPTWWDFYSEEDAHRNSAEDITISSFPTTISFTYENGIKLKSVQTPPADPAGKRNISKYVNAVEVTADSWIFMNVNYEEGDLVGVNENSLRMWTHNGTDWTEVPGTNGVNTAENYVYANITEFSVFAPLGNVTGVKLEINKTCVPDPVSPSGTLNYTISVNNTGNATATNVTVKETYDENVTFVTAVPAPSSGNDTWVFATLNVSETKWVNISVLVNASAPNGTVLHNVVNVTCDEGVSDFDSEDTTVLSALAPVLEINKTGVPDSAPAGGTLNYSIHVNNTGNATATNVTVMETYDENVTFVVAVPAPSSGNDTWVFATLNASETRWINISVSVNASVLNGTVLHNIVNVTCAEAVIDTDTENTTVFAIPSIPKVKLSKWVKYKREPDSEYRKEIDDAKVCNNVSFKIAVQNSGIGTNLTGISVTDVLNCSLGYINDSANIPPNIYENNCPGTQTLIWQFATVWHEPGKYINITFDAHVDKCGHDRNYACVDSISGTGCNVSDEDYVYVNCTITPVCVETATGTGLACFDTDSGTIEDLVAVDESTLPEEGKPELVFPHGFFSFNIIGLTPGQTVEVTLTLPDNVPVGTQYWKYHASEGGWIRIPMGSDDGDNILTITLVDGGLGDDDGTANGVIVDRGGPGVRAIKPTLTKSAPTSVAPGGTITYTILYANVGPVALTNVAITENYPEGVTFISADPAPDAGTNNKWTLGTLPAGSSGKIVIKVKVPESRDLTFTETGSVIGEGFVMVGKDLSTEQKPYRLKNVVTISCAETDLVSASALTTVSGVPGTSLEITEHGSGIYESEEILNFGTKNKSIRLQKSTEAEYLPTSFNFSDGFSVDFTNKWMQDICSKNMVLGDAMHKKIKHATYIKDETKTETGEYGTSMEFASSFQGAAHIGAVSKDVTTSEDYIGEFEIFWAAKEECQYLFNWSRVPGNDSEKLIRFLVDNPDINLYWAENATITKSNDDRVINISTDWHSAEVILAANNETATVKVANEIIYVLDVRTEDGGLNLNVYDCRLRKISESVAGEGYVMVDKELTSGYIQVVEHGSGIYSSDTDFDSQRLNKSTEAEYQPTTFNFSDGFSVNFSSNWMQGICSKDKKAGTAIHKKISDAVSIADDTTATKSSMAFETSFNGSIHVGARTTGTRISEDYIGRFNVSQVIKIGKATSTSTANSSNSSDLPSCP